MNSMDVLLKNEAEVKNKEKEYFERLSIIRDDMILKVRCPR